MNLGSDSPQQDPNAASETAGAAVASKRSDGGPSWLILGTVALLVMMLVRGLLLQSFFVPSGSMQPTIEPGDRILVNKVVSGDALRRGDVVVFDGTATFGGEAWRPRPPDGFVGKLLAGAATLVGVQVGEQDFVKRIIGLPGDHVVCCDSEGRISVNDVPVDEEYIASGDKPSEVTFDITVPAGRIWVMGDHRSDSSDSRAHLGKPGYGTVRIDDVVGRAAVTYWPISRLGGFSTPQHLAEISRAAAP